MIPGSEMFGQMAFPAIGESCRISLTFQRRAGFFWFRLRQQG